jgi:hypothetical protein
MPFGYEYLMVYLPEICPTSFLLFVHNPKGETKLRDYSSGRERCLSEQVSAAEVLRRTTFGQSRFVYPDHPVDGNGVRHWVQVTRKLNEGPKPPGSDPFADAILAALPPKLAELDAAIRWKSPLAEHTYEFGDTEFLSALEIEGATVLPVSGLRWGRHGMR